MIMGGVVGCWRYAIHVNVADDHSVQDFSGSIRSTWKRQRLMTRGEANAAWLNERGEHKRQAGCCYGHHHELPHTHTPTRHFVCPVTSSLPHAVPPISRQQPRFPSKCIQQKGIAWTLVRQRLSVFDRRPSLLGCWVMLLAVSSRPRKGVRKQNVNGAVHQTDGNARPTSVKEQRSAPVGSQENFRDVKARKSHLWWLSVNTHLVNNSLTFPTYVVFYIKNILNSLVTPISHL
jgi:hypothetical protein